MSKKGISLVVVLIIVIVLIILASAVIIPNTGSSNNIIDTSNDITFKYNVQVMIDNYNNVYNSMLQEYDGDETKIKDEDFNINQII